MYFLSVNFHYIEEEGLYPYPGIYPTPISRLKNQLIELSKIFKFISQDDLINAIDGTISLSERSCLITFDDGLRCQYENAIPVLDELEIPAVFFVGGMPLAQGRALNVHKIHWIRVYTEPSIFLEQLYDEYKRLTGGVFNMSQFNISASRAKQVYRYDTEVDAQIKLILNKVLSPALRDQIIDALFAKLVSNEKSFCQKFYMDAEQINNLYKRGWLGVHSYSHPPLSTLSKEEIKKEYILCIQTIGDVIKNTKPVFLGVSYPYGSPEAVSREVGIVAQECGLRYGLTMERSFNATLKEPMMFSRIDTNDALGGKSPLFIVDNEKIIITNDSLKERRGIYVQD